MNKKILFLTLFFFMFSFLSVDANKKRVIKLDSPKETTLKDCAHAACVNVDKNLRICKCLKDNDDSDSDAVFILERAGKSVLSWPTTAFLGDTKSFEVLKTDLDSNGHDELIVANLNTVSNGMGVSYWTVAILENKAGNYQSPLLFDTQEYGEGTISFTTGSRYGQILASEWCSNKDKKRGWGLYFVARWFNYKNGYLIPIKTKDVIARRYLFGFEKERLKKEKSAPLKWANHPQSENRKNDPLILPVVKEKVSGTVISIKKDSFLKLRLKIKLETGQEKEFLYPFENYEEGAKDKPDLNKAINRLGEELKLYPENYLPVDAENWLVGKKISLITYPKAEYGESGTIMIRVLLIEQ
jgi:hypothetical protein